VWIFETSNIWSWEKALGYKTYDFGRFVQGLDEEDMGKLLQMHPQSISISLRVFINILIGLFPSNLCLFRYGCLINGFDWTNLIEYSRIYLSCCPLHCRCQTMLRRSEIKL
jgi:hypothetical protein